MIVEPLAREWPYLTEQVPAVPAVARTRYEDFEVEEVPAYEPAGEGDHVFFRVEKRGLATMRAVHDIARRLGVAARDIGVAGLKDARALTRQTLSVEHVEPERILALDIPRIRILEARRHPKKLRTGHLRANRFRIRLRPADDDAGPPLAARLPDVSRVLEILRERGAPNYFGPQRFGIRGDTGAIGRALLTGDFDGAAALIAGRARTGDAPDLERARALYDEGRYGEAARAWPRGFREPAAVSKAMERTGGDARASLRTLARRSLGFYVSAYQSWLFNEVLAERLHGLDDVLEGDLAWKHDSGAIFSVEDVAAERPRARRGEISPTGPLFGPRMDAPEGEPGRIEEGVLSRSTEEPGLFTRPGPYRPRGGRRPLRIIVDDLSVEAGEDEAGEFLELRFSLPPGGYATGILREISKERLEVATAGDFEAEEG